MTDQGDIIEGVDDDIALRVVVRVEPLDAEQDSLDVDVLVHEDLDDEWAIGILRQIANDLEAGAR